MEETPHYSINFPSARNTALGVALLAVLAFVLGLVGVVI